MLAATEAVTITIWTTLGGIMVAAITALLAPTVLAWSKRKFNVSPPPDVALPHKTSTQDVLTLDLINRLNRVEVELDKEEAKTGRLHKELANVKAQLEQSRREVNEAHTTMAELRAQVLRLEAEVQRLLANRTG